MKLRKEITLQVTKRAVIDLVKGKTMNRTSDSIKHRRHHSLILSPVLPEGQLDEHTFLHISFLKIFEDSYLSWKIKRSSFGVIEHAIDQESKITGFNLEPLDFCVISGRSLCLSGSISQKIFPFIPVYFERL